MSTYKEESRKRWGDSKGGVPSIEQIKLGCMLRIADATEAIATEHNRLIAENTQITGHYKYSQLDNNRLRKSNAALKGQVTKLKNKLNTATEELKQVKQNYLNDQLRKQP